MATNGTRKLFVNLAVELGLMDEITHLVLRETIGSIDRINEVFGPDSSFNEFMTHPVAGFLVDDIEAARAEMEANGIEFLGPIQGETDDYKWTHFRAPDGFVYELTYSAAHPSIAEQRALSQE